MKLPFRTPSRYTEVRHFPSLPALGRALASADAWILVDAGVSRTLPFVGRGVLEIGGGEECKRWSQLEKILAWLAESGAERSQPLVVIGGGAVLDLGAFAASLYRRGMPLILVPTSLLGMVDAALGGKTAVDLERDGHVRKNFAGTFYPAGQVWLATDFLRTLPERERLSGAGEVFKSMWIAGKKWNRAPLVEYVRSGKVSKGLETLIRACLSLKCSVVAKDPLDEKRLREVLNFGHTVGHALESTSSLSHGECVLWGMAVETALLGKSGKPMARQCSEAVASLARSFPAELGQISAAEWITLLGADKKARGGKIEMSLLAKPGKVVKRRFSADEIAHTIREFPGSFQL
ncbi:MAG TPA: 3-dehydroquinate synthase family protein [Bdellovibrionota bacterium]|jgi:3-dehydroquinate synthase